MISETVKLNLPPVKSLELKPFFTSKYVPFYACEI